MMPPKLRGKWALGIQPRNFTWILKDKMAVCERPGGFGSSHRRVRRQEEIIWIRENGFNYVVSLIQALTIFITMKSLVSRIGTGRCAPTTLMPG